MVKTKFKKAVSLMLAAVMSLTAFMGIGATTAFAAVGEKADVYLVDYPRSGDTNNNGEWGHGNLNYMNGWKGLSTKYTGLRAMGSYSGNIAYCIEPGTGQRTGDTLTEKGENFFNNISPNGTISGDDIRLLIGRIFACSLRMGEMLGLTWDCIDISEESLRENNASIYVDKELQRVNRDVMEVLDNKDIIRVFPRTLSNTNTSLVLKTPKTKTSVRKIFLPSTVAQMLLERKKQIDEMKELFGDEYLDYDLVFCHSSGRPMEGQVINRALKKLIQDNDLPDVVFHSFRHASITYKLKWNGGDMKSVQGDSGHARMDMVADVYSHIIDEDRRYNAQKFEEQFYNAKGLKNAEEGKTAPMPKFETSVELLDPMAEVQKGSEVEEEKPAENSADENAALLAKLLSNPDTAALLKALAKTI